MWTSAKRTGILLLLSFVFALGQSQLVDQVRYMTSSGDLRNAIAMVENYQSKRGTTPELAEAMSWIARGEIAAGNYKDADDYAAKARELSGQQLAGRSVDVNASLATAVGAAIEVHAQVLVHEKTKAAAAQYLCTQLTKYASTSIGPRIQKNLNLLTLVGSPAPPLDESAFIGAKPPTLASLHGKPVLMYFWAHWCPDCKAEAPILARLQSEFAPQGLTLLGPTQLYGAIGQGEDAPPAAEMKYIEQVRDKYYSDLRNVPVPVSAANFHRYGASTTPTLVLIDPSGRVAMYHPGRMTYDELHAAIEGVLSAKHS